MWRGIVAKCPLNSVGHSLVVLRNLEEASASRGVFHFGGMCAAFLGPITVAPHSFPVSFFVGILRHRISVCLALRRSNAPRP